MKRLFSLAVVVGILVLGASMMTAHAQVPWDNTVRHYGAPQYFDNGIMLKSTGVWIDGTNLPSGQSAFLIQNRAYIRVMNLGVMFARQYAFHVYGASAHDIDVIECFTYNTFGPGVRAQDAGNVRVR